MEPLTAISLASAIVQFVDFSVKLVNGAREIYHSATGSTAQNVTFEVVVGEMKAWSSRLSCPTPLPDQSDEEKAICSLAKECQRLSGEILELVQKTRPRKRKSRTDSVWAAAKEKWYGSDKLEMLKRLSMCRRQLTMQLETLDRSKMTSYLKDLVESAESDGPKFAALQKRLEDLQRGTKVSSISPEVQNWIRGLLDVPKHAIAEFRILQSLAFDKMHSRVDNVNKAHFKTFQWILEDEPYAVGSDRPSAVSFTDWLTDGTGIFHIAGKLGSGKSTLMKFICEHERTTDLLNRWVGEGRKLVIARFFFWRAGDEDQKSLSGLLRSLLHNTLEQCPDLMPLVFPQQWQEIISMDWRIQKKLNLSKNEIRTAFERLIQSPESYENRRFCFFIDGLDEYEETCHEDYSDMIDLLFSWTKAAQGCVKLCVSSREYNVFQKAFSDDKRLRLQMLTMKDMESFIYERLKSFEISEAGAALDENTKTLVNEITVRADGIFLWVALVLKSLREGLQSDNRLCSLIQKVKDVPREMEPLFQYLLDSINPSDRKAVYRTFAVMLKLKELHCSDMSVFSYSFLEDYEVNPDFAMDADFKDFGEGKAEIASRLAWAPGRINGQGKGLLEVGSSNFLWSRKFCPESITFTHRSVYDFVSGCKIQKTMASHYQKFDVVEAICQTFLAEFKFSGEICEHEKSSLANHVQKIVRLRIRNAKDAAPFRFLECLHATILRSQNVGLDDVCKKVLVAPSGLLRSKVYGWSVVSVLHIAASLQHMDYISWKVADNPTLMKDEMKSSMLLGAVVFDVPERGLAGLRFLAARLREGVTLNGAAKIPFVWSHLSYKETVWQWILKTAVVVLSDLGETDKRLFGDVMEAFLKSGADPLLRINKNLFYSHLLITTRRPPFPLKFTPKTEKFLQEKGGDVGVSLDDLFDFLQLENAEKLKELTSRNLLTRLKAGDGSQECETKDQPAEQTPQLMTDEMKTPDVILAAVPELASTGVVESQVATVGKLRRLRERLALHTRSPLLIFVFGLHETYFGMSKTLEAVEIARWVPNQRSRQGVDLDISHTSMLSATASEGSMLNENLEKIAKLIGRDRPLKSRDLCQRWSHRL